MTHAVVWVWVLYEKASCREASRIRVLVRGQGGGGGARSFPCLITP